MAESQDFVADFVIIVEAAESGSKRFQMFMHLTVLAVFSFSSFPFFFFFFLPDSWNQCR